jgi:hypothetical protein
MNVPGRANGNWRWRVTEKTLSTSAFPWLRDLSERSKRCANARPNVQTAKAQGQDSRKRIVDDTSSEQRIP